MKCANIPGDRIEEGLCRNRGVELTFDQPGPLKCGFLYGKEREELGPPFSESTEEKHASEPGFVRGEVEEETFFFNCTPLGVLYFEICCSCEKEDQLGQRLWARERTVEPEVLNTWYEGPKAVQERCGTKSGGDQAREYQDCDVGEARNVSQTGSQDYGMNPKPLLLVEAEFAG